MKKNKEVFAFVIMPFNENYDDIYNLGIKAAAKECGIRAERLDEQLFREGMLERIYEQIDIADIVIADLSDRNPNVFYELGYAHAKEKLCILLTGDANDIPFDLKHKRHIVYCGKISNLKDELKSNLDWAVTEIDNIRNSRIRIDVGTPVGTLKTTSYSAEANVKFMIDLHNDTSRPSPDITAVYLYTKNKWTMYQDDKEVGMTKSDVQGYENRYFLSPPVKRLEKKSWAQLKFAGNVVLAQRWKGEEIKTEYNIAGNSMLRVVSNSGSFDYELNFNFSVDELPF